MALASLLDAGADIGYVISGLRELPLGGWYLEAAKTSRAGLAATELRVEVPSAEATAERTWGTVRSIIDRAAGLPPRVRQRAQGAFARLAEAEGRLHGLPPEDVHFHEVGALDAIIDVVGTCLALEYLGVDHVHSSAVALGTGTIRAAHGPLPNPAPAVVELLSGAPVVGTPYGVELTTPTGAALLAGLAESFGPVPPLWLRAGGYGAGARDLEGLPNVVQVVIGELVEPGGLGPGELEELVVLETNLDDVTGEVLAHTVSSLLAAGALDAWLVPVVAKKGRPGHVVNVLSSPATAGELAQLLAAETGTLGVRQYLVTRWAVPRRVVEVQVESLPIRVKSGPHRLKAEHDDCARAAANTGLPLREVARRAEEAAAGGDR